MKTTNAKTSVSRTNADQLVVVDRAQCEAMSRFFAAYTIPQDREDSELPGINRELIPNFYFLLVAICHQTSPRGRSPLEGVIGGVHRRGWDYLFKKLELVATSDTSLLRPDRWRHIDASSIDALFEDPRFGRRLYKPKERAALIQDLGDRMCRLEWDSITRLYEQTDGRIREGEPNFLHELSKFRAYRDPVCKKSLFFLSIMSNAGLWTFKDIENLGPPVDYHEIRGHLRVGTIRIIDDELLQKVRNQQPVNEADDIAIRAAVFDAIVLITERLPGVTPSMLHYLYWNVFRSICTRDNPQCFSLDPNNTLPDRYMPLTHSCGQKKTCPFNQFCRSAGASKPICEHVFETDYY